jgi:hypothetical protein
LPEDSLVRCGPSSEESVDGIYQRLKILGADAQAKNEHAGSDAVPIEHAAEWLREDEGVQRMNELLDIARACRDAQAAKDGVGTAA